MLRTKVSILLSNYFKHPHTNDSVINRCQSKQHTESTIRKQIKKPTIINLRSSKAKYTFPHASPTQILPSIYDSASSSCKLITKTLTTPLPIIRNNFTDDTFNLDELIYYHINTSSSLKKRVNGYSDEQIERYRLDNIKANEDNKMQRIKTKVSKTYHYKIVNIALSKMMN